MLSLFDVGISVQVEVYNKCKTSIPYLWNCGIYTLGVDSEFQKCILYILQKFVSTKSQRLF